VRTLLVVVAVIAVATGAVFYARFLERGSWDLRIGLEIRSLGLAGIKYEVCCGESPASLEDLVGVGLIEPRELMERFIMSAAKIDNWPQIDLDSIDPSKRTARIEAELARVVTMRNAIIEGRSTGDGYVDTHVRECTCEGEVEDDDALP
jgi:hypothetical protein